jgi:hypothetical protein
VIHVGDSRAYLLRDGRLHQLTRDQTLVQTLVDLGELTPEGASSHPLGHLLTHALGLHHGRINVEAQRLKLRDGDCLLVCTDGLTEMAANERSRRFCFGLNRLLRDAGISLISHREGWQGQCDRDHSPLPPACEGAAKKRSRRFSSSDLFSIASLRRFREASGSVDRSTWT